MKQLDPIAVAGGGVGMSSTSVVAFALKYAKVDVTVSGIQIFSVAVPYWYYGATLAIGLSVIAYGINGYYSKKRLEALQQWQT